MILTVTMNPSIDIAYIMDSFVPDQVNRVKEIHKTAGGKGLNVTRVLRKTGNKVLATGLTGGKNGEFLKEQLDHAGVVSDFYEIKGDTRNCIAILHEGKQTEILEAGPAVSQEEYAGFIDHFQMLVQRCAAAVFSGTPPRGIEDDCYACLTEIAKKYSVPVILDCSAAPFQKALTSEYKPDAVKPNIHELQDLLNREISKDPECLKEALSEKLFDGIAWIVVSLGADGCFAKHHDTFYTVKIPKISVISAVGSGDASVAGIAAGIVKGMNDEELLKHANTLGMLNAQEKETGTVNLDHYGDLYRQIIVTKV